MKRYPIIQFYIAIYHEDVHEDSYITTRVCVWSAIQARMPKHVC